MRRIFVTVVVALAALGAAAAVEVPLRDGTVIAADSYTVSGSYVVIKLPNGSQVAYDVIDVDLEALRAAEAAAATGEPAPPPPGPSGEAISAGRSLKSADEAGADEGAALAITDRDVKHVRGSGVRGEEEQAEAEAAPAAGPPEGYRVGGGVVLNALRVERAGEGQWQVRGEVVNRNPFPALNVIVKLETTIGPDAEPWSAEMQVASALGPDEKAAFEHGFADEVKEGERRSDVRASVMWMQEQTRREPNYTGAGGVPHPSSLPLNVGGVSGADPRPTPRQ